MIFGSSLSCALFLMIEPLAVQLLFGVSFPRSRSLSFILAMLTGAVVMLAAVAFGIRSIPLNWLMSTGFKDFPFAAFVDFVDLSFNFV